MRTKIRLVRSPYPSPPFPHLTNFPLPPQSRTISRPEWDTYVVPYLLNDYKPNPDSLNPSGALNRLFHPTLEEVVGEDLSFGSAFFNSWSLIIATELGDKTFFIAAILCLRFSR